ncbi:MmgE/PrpD family protein [Pandoraea sp. XJJ-1]|uniref:MmgE/PrpD family protein n=1 Tax=Pandoraea sp. XJJ-1 TaxID=3002643 RepID=UPI00227DDB33|nr:MmgE/PrpD family protein [Pandoraea sp. XJJ-1]WAL84016.1 MmgE/PrpD family protein [Pandoraea sp. XJJ-1]
MDSKNLIRHLAQHVHSTRFEDLTPAEVDRTKQCLLDCLGNMLAGRFSGKADGFLRHAASSIQPDGATIFGFQKVTLEKATFCNAAFSRVMDLDDGHRRAMGHPGVVIIPTVLAVGEVLHATTQEAIAAIVAAYDVYVEIGMAINPYSYTVKGFDTTGVAGTVAAAAAIAKLKHLDMETTKHAMAIAALHSGGFIEYLSDGSSGKLLCPAWTAATGLRSVEMAECGFTGPDSVLEGAHGLFRCFSENADLSNFGATLGTTRHIMTAYFKAHACLRRLHAAIDALLAARKRHALSLENVRRIVVNAGDFVLKADARRPTTLVAAQGSMPFVLAVALRHGKVSRESLQSSMGDPELEAVQDTISLKFSEAISARQASDSSLWGEVQLEIETTDGRIITEHAAFGSGEPEAPMSWNELQRKFVDQLQRTPAASEALRLASFVAQFDAIDGVDTFVQTISLACPAQNAANPAIAQGS